MPTDSFIQIPQPIDPHLRRWMLFVDGENFTLRGQKVASDNGVTLFEGAQYQRDVFVWVPNVRPTLALTNQEHAPLKVQPHAIRAYYYTSMVGDDVRLDQIRTALWSLGFHPEVFKKERKEEKAKGVDIALAKDFLSHAFLDNYDVAVLLAGDGDYVPLVNEVKRLGKAVYVSFFAGSGLSPKLHLASDMFFDWTPFFLDRWKEVSQAATPAVP